MLIGQGEELANGPGADRLHGLEQPFYHAAQHLLGLQVRWRFGQARVIPVEHDRAQAL
jgi:hypothetical protein